MPTASSQGTSNARGETIPMSRDNGPQMNKTQRLKSQGQVVSISTPL